MCINIQMLKYIAKKCEYLNNKIFSQIYKFQSSLQYIIQYIMQYITVPPSYNLTVR